MTRQVLISEEIPEIYDTLKIRFGVDWNKGLVIAYKGKIHTKDQKTIEVSTIFHELVHLDQQEELGHDTWWRLYLESDDFRYEQELMAYKKQANVIKQNIKNRNHASVMIMTLAKQLASSQYGNLLSERKAYSLLR